MLDGPHDFHACLGRPAASMNPDPQPIVPTPSFDVWNASLGSAAVAIGTRGFPDALAAVLKLLAPFQMMNGFLYSRDGHAFDLYNEKIVAERSVIVDRYLAGAFVLDPFYDAVRSDDSERMIVMRDIAPDDFQQTEYYRLHYATTRIVDEIGFVMRLEAGFIGVLSLSRTGTAPLFSQDDLQRLRAAAPAICAFGERHWFHVPGLSLNIENAPPARIEHPLLTRRELEIVTLILKGHSNLSLAAVLSLSPNTVKVHRRQIYSKLTISSQAELFRLFMA
ncbi:LuxR C-terminal-related transcriptional regulator [Rhizobium ruizarguesonis]|uniref:helix-turn-helix transcriptional regulator n=2 Tax=Rhizobium ruizarguesonis TaxID=2081791 RepID=UPI0010315F5C|nr:LuxR C-terminal-related transcriptional regulator [Rhizobium ruizarguesonis]TAV07517.1 response regulator transcription factor [Rhizobium ruizarguesonis]TAZ96842.1 response regulator transcription factor [Rhizobium ruizarguesonis]TBA39725.1 response regulator transcription factor [Rhizobium ruizarguesonis]TBA82457.1 response regulator transcription factor [Rhizobium ruizarguesonis]TBB77591.1 response regulator transcription factor [Rhizobium ruizarguesonis]